MARKFIAETADFFDTAIDYLRKWSSVMGHVDSFKWMILNMVPMWCGIENTLSYLKTKKVQLSEAEVFGLFVCLKTFVSINLGTEECESTNMQDKWLKFFQTVNHLEQYSELLKICEYIFSVPAHNANVERIFSLMAAQWTDERNRLSIGTIDSISPCHYNFNMTCSQFYNYVKTNPSMLSAVKSLKNMTGMRKEANNLNALGGSLYQFVLICILFSNYL
jgi:hypothetical protein